MSDYQGNNRVLFKDVDGTAEIVEDYGGYYPFGAIHQQQSDYQNKYLNEGKELQTELSLEWSDYHLRCKDNWMGRFTGIDVLADSYSNSSPYSYGLGNSISNGDPTGASVEKFTGDEAQQVFSGVQNSYNNAVASGENVNKNLWSSSSSSSGEVVGLQANSYNGSALSGQFSSLFGIFSGGGDEEDEEEVGFGESLIPVWGSIQLARQNFRKGEVGWGIFNSIMAISDVFLVKSIFTGIARGGFRALAMGNRPWSARNFWDPNSSYRSFYGSSGFAAQGQHIHHRFIHQRGPIGRFIPNFIKHQMWNLHPVVGRTIDGTFFNSRIVHQAIHNNSRQLTLTRWQQFRFGTPEYIYTLPMSGLGRVIENKLY